MNYFQQILKLTQVNIRSLPSRWRTGAVLVTGIAAVSAVLISIMALLNGFEHTVQSAGKDNVAIVIRDSAGSEMRSFMRAENADIIASTIGSSGASRELYTSAELPHPNSDFFLNIGLRGVADNVFEVHEPPTFLQGQMFQSGTTEIIVGAKAYVEIGAPALNSKIEIGNVEWNIVGVFADAGSVYESEIWMDVILLRQLFNRGYSSVRVKFDNPVALQEMREALANDARLSVQLMTEREYFNSQSMDISRFITLVGLPLIVLMSLGAILASVNTMGILVDSRMREYSTLQAIGYKPGSVYWSCVLESLFLALLGAAIGLGLVFLVANGYEVTTVNQVSFSQVHFTLSINANVAMKAFVLALILGVIGSVASLLKIRKMSVAEALC
jgi:putative ABC transport system permease protein